MRFFIILEETKIYRNEALLLILQYQNVLITSCFTTISTGELQRKLGVKVHELGGNAVLG